MQLKREIAHTHKKKTIRECNLLLLLNWLVIWNSNEMESHKMGVLLWIKCNCKNVLLNQREIGKTPSFFSSCENLFLYLTSTQFIHRLNYIESWLPDTCLHTWINSFSIVIVVEEQWLYRTTFTHLEWEEREKKERGNWNDVYTQVNDLKRYKTYKTMSK